MPVCVAGMHRSGTSLIVRLLNLCGLYMGPDEDIIQPRHDNPSGFWENINFLALNEELLAHLGASWDLPPSPDRLAKLKTTNSTFREKAGKLIATFEGREPWGWKDPRNSLTLPFWKAVIPGLKVVICVRNPLEVFQSLNKRGGSSFLFSITLWLIYNQFVLDATSAGERIITHFDSYFHNPGAEISRVLEFCGIKKNQEVLEEACTNVSPAMRHNRATTQQLAQTGASQQLINLYLDLCLEAGPVCQAAMEV